ncbi:prominin isoform X2 [Rhodnius prolixus]
MAIPGMTLSLCTATPIEPPPSCATDLKRRSLIFCLQTLLVLLLLGTVTMLWTNEECSEGIVKAPEVTNSLLQDSSNFIEDSIDKLQYLLTDSFHMTLEPASRDLNDAENLLGTPIQVELALETGLNVALESLSKIAAGGKDVCSLAAAIIRSSLEAEQLITLTKGRLDDLRNQLESLKEQCKARDRPLCDSIPFESLDVKYSTRMITNDTKMKKLKQGGVDNLTIAIMEANSFFTGLPVKIAKETKSFRQDVLRDLLDRKTFLNKAAASLDQIKINSFEKIQFVKSTNAPIFDFLQEIDYWRWLIGLISGVMVVFIWFLLLASILCGCCEAEKYTSYTLIVTLVILSMFSVCLWSWTYLLLYFGGHAETYICRSLNEDYDNLVTVSKVVDMLEEFYDEGGSFVGKLLHNNRSMNMPFGDFMHLCKRNGSTYIAFNTKTILDIEELTNITSWNITENLQRIRVNLLYLQIFNPKLNSHIIKLQESLTVNVSSFRTQIMGPVSTDLEAFSNHLTSIAKQISDLDTANHLNSLSARSKRLLATLIQDLESHKDNIVYQLTALELKLSPLIRQVNQTLSHIKAVQYYIYNNGLHVAQQSVEIYSKRVNGYFQQYFDYVQKSIHGNSTSCQPLWQIYKSFRQSVCRRTIDPLNGQWFSSLWCLSIFMVITPICLKLIAFYKQEVYIDPAEISTSETFVNEEESSSWSAPAGQSPPVRDWL